VNGGFAEYCAYPQGKVFHLKNLNDVDATLLEPASCAAHGLEKIAPKLGSSVLMIGAGPTGLVLAQLLKLNGGCHVTLAANAGIKMELAQKLEAADEFIFLDRKHPEKQWEQIKSDNPYVSPGLGLRLTGRGLILLLKRRGVPKSSKMQFTMSAAAVNS
jgi:D-arabinitol dehydrogenase (NADP+)